MGGVGSFIVILYSVVDTLTQIIQTTLKIC